MAPHYPPDRFLEHVGSHLGCRVLVFFGGLGSILGPDTLAGRVLKIASVSHLLFTDLGALFGAVLASKTDARLDLVFGLFWGAFRGQAPRSLAEGQNQCKNGLEKGSPSELDTDQILDQNGLQNRTLGFQQNFPWIPVGTLGIQHN